MHYGRGWILIEQHFHSGTRRLVSILPPRKRTADVAAYIGQAYVDRYASIQEKLSYKKNRALPAYEVSGNPFDTVMHCGHEPSFVCFYAHKISLRETTLEFEYRICVNREDPMKSVFETRQQSIEVAL